MRDILPLLNIFMNRHKLGLSLILAIGFASNLFGQQIVYYPKDVKYTPLTIFVVQNQYFASIKDTIDANSSAYNSSYLLINGETMNPTQIKDTVNNILNLKHRVNYVCIYLVVVGDHPFYEFQDKLNTDLFAKICFVSTDTLNSTYPKVITLPIQKFKFDNLYYKLKEYYLYQYQFSDIVDKAGPKQTAFVKNYELGIGASFYFPFGVRTTEDMPTYINNLDVVYGIRFYENYKIWGDISFGKGLISKKNQRGTLNVSDVDDGDAIGGMVTTRSFNISRMFNAKSALNPYIALGITHATYNIMYQGSTGMIRYSSGGLGVTTGFDFYTPLNVMLGARASYNVSLNSYNTINSLSVSFNLSYWFKLTKRPYYNYLRLND